MQNGNCNDNLLPQILFLCSSVADVTLAYILSNYTRTPFFKLQAMQVTNNRWDASMQLNTGQMDSNFV